MALHSWGPWIWGYLMLGRDCTDAERHRRHSLFILQTTIEWSSEIANSMWEPHINLLHHLGMMVTTSYHPLVMLGTLYFWIHQLNCLLLGSKQRCILSHGTFQRSTCDHESHLILNLPIIYSMSTCLWMLVDCIWQTLVLCGNPWNQRSQLSVVAIVSPVSPATFCREPRAVVALHSDVWPGWKKLEALLSSTCTISIYPIPWSLNMMEYLHLGHLGG